MGTRLNPDGDRIKALRIERGWTQEQLAEIAGVSSRTVQRAEGAESASFDTVRALAGAFEMDFDQLLKPEPPASDPEPQPGEQTANAWTSRIPDHMDDSCAPVPVVRKWTTFLVAAAALSVGLVLGGIVTHRFRTPAAPHLPLPRAVVNLPAQVGKPQGVMEPERKAASALRNVSSRGMQSAIPNQKDGSVAERGRDRNSDSRPPEVIDGPIFTVHSALAFLQPTTVDLPAKPREVLADLAAPAVPSEWSALAIQDVSAPDAVVTGAVKDAFGQAGQATGSAFGRVRSSLKRLF